MDEKVDDQSQKAQAADANDKPKENYEAKYKEQQAKYERLVEESKSTKEMLDAVTPYVNWDAAQGKSQETQETTESEYIDRKSVEAMRLKDRELNENELLELRFEVSNPDLKPYMKLVKAELLDARSKNPRATKKQLLDLAADSARQFLKKEREAAVEATKKKQIKEDEIAASGLDAKGNTSPKPEEKGQTNDEYANERRSDLTQRKGNQLIKM